MWTIKLWSANQLTPPESGCKPFSLTLLVKGLAGATRLELLISNCVLAIPSVTVRHGDASSHSHPVQHIIFLSLVESCCNLGNFNNEIHSKSIPAKYLSLLLDYPAPIKQVLPRSSKFLHISWLVLDQISLLLCIRHQRSH